MVSQVDNQCNTLNLLKALGNVCDCIRLEKYKEVTLG